MTQTVATRIDLRAACRSLGTCDAVPSSLACEKAGVDPRTHTVALGFTEAAAAHHDGRLVARFRVRYGDREFYVIRRSDASLAAQTLGSCGGRARAAAMTPAQRSEAQRTRVRARWVTRPVIAVRHDATTREQVEGPWLGVGTATTWTEAIRLARGAGYRVPSRRTPGWAWDTVPRDLLTREQAGAMWDEAREQGAVDAFGVPVLIG